MAARDEILDKLRSTLNRPDLRFPPANPQPLTSATRMTVGSAPEADAAARAARFGAELETLHGTFEVADSPVAARLLLINRLLEWMRAEVVDRKGTRFESGQERAILSWHPDRLPIVGLADALADLQLDLVVPTDLTTTAARDAVKYIRYGLTGVEAAFAATGSMLVFSGTQTNRAASLLPLRHIALIPFSRLYPTVEDWLAEQRAAGRLDDLVREQANLTMITGPSKSADIEMNLTLGVHGPKFVHAILFDD